VKALRRARSAAILLAAAGLLTAAPAPPAVSAALPGPNLPSPAPPLLGPFHGSLRGIAYGGHGELRLADDRTRGVSKPEWFSIDRVDGFVSVQIRPRLELAGRGAWDHGTDDFSMERAELGFKLRPTLQLHGGIFLVPLGRTNLEHDAPLNEFDEQSLVATQLIGVPNAELGAGMRGVSRTSTGRALEYEVDLVTGLDDGLIMDSPGGTRLAEGRNNYGDNNGLPALACRLALHPRPRIELGLAAQSGPYNKTEIGGVRVDERRWVHLLVGDAATRLLGIDLFGETAAALIDVPPGLRSLYAQRQWGASIEGTRVIRQPIFGSWTHSSLTAAVRLDAVDFDPGVPGDSRARISASLNVRRLPLAVARFGWYYEVRRDRFNNETPMAGVTFTAASYF
jgi:hypothetical protein